MKLFLDDIREPYDSTWVLVKNYEQFVEFIEKNGIPEKVSFDHDLDFQHYLESTTGIPYDQYDEKTGLDCAKYFVEKLIEYNNTGGKLTPEAIIHSMNPVGAANIAGVLKGHCHIITYSYQLRSSKEKVVIVRK